MEKNSMGFMKSMALGMAVGTALTAAGAMYINDNRSEAQKAIKKAKNSKKIITKAGENIIKEITD